MRLKSFFVAALVFSALCVGTTSRFEERWLTARTSENPSLNVHYRSLCYSSLSGTTCTVAPRTSLKNRLITDPCSKMSHRERADCPNTT